MKNPFCDLCLEPAVPIAHKRVDVLKPWSGYRTTKSGDGYTGTHQPTVNVRLQCSADAISTVNDGDPPDLCPACQVKLLAALIQSLGHQQTT